MTTTAIVLAAWAVLSIPAGVLVGCAIRAGALADAS
jgi:hypothetical protein